LARDKAHPSSDRRILTRKCCDRFRSVGAYWVLSQLALCSPLNGPWRLLVVMGMGVLVCLFGFGLFKLTRPQAVSIGGSSSPTPAPLAAASNSPSTTPSVGQALPSPTMFGAEWLAEAKRYLDA